jgi:hypothetical protein
MLENANPPNSDVQVSPVTAEECPPLVGWTGELNRWIISSIHNMNSAQLEINTLYFFPSSCLLQNFERFNTSQLMLCLDKSYSYISSRRQLYFSGSVASWWCTAGRNCPMLTLNIVPQRRLIFSLSDCEGAHVCFCLHSHDSSDKFTSIPKLNLLNLARSI